jgi:hypothetical protein
MLRVVAVAFVLLSGCMTGPDGLQAPEDWRPSSAPAGPQRSPDGLFQFVDVTGALRPLDQEWTAPDCLMTPPNADVDVGRRSITLPADLLERWRPNATLLVRDGVHRHAPGSSCNAAGLFAPHETDLRFHGEESTMGLTMGMLALVGGPAIGAFRPLEEGIPYRHVVEWQEVDPAYGDVQSYRLEAEFVYRGLWSWDDATAGVGGTTWAG